MKSVTQILTALMVVSASGAAIAKPQSNEVLNQVINSELQQHVALTSQEINTDVRNDVLNTSYQFSPKVSKQQMVAKVTVRQLKEVDLRKDTDA
ncbi:hypothetical protein OPS25_14830 [Alteromonas ponticola]|uniref:DUF3316 domain-containing protein n=1 Tax=Alteromonas aquimaris TaxID=2998417 RepID=A0ABT3PAG9_9ALTE|nr:hypothetical protein [Alteromonas aquimaris]MCW8109779.1 hypothetical protein [Alteromonas aquimaris]